MTCTNRAKLANETRCAGWQRLPFACLGAIAGAGYGFGISAPLECGPLTTWILVLVGSGLLGMIGFKIAGSPVHSAVQKVILIPLVPVALAASFVGITVVIVLFGVLYPVFAIADLLRERRFRDEMQAAGRFITWQQLLPLLESGHGTLLEESYGTGPLRIWHTSDDVLANGEPVLTDEEMFDVLSGKASHVFNSRCLRKYLDSDKGTALLTDIRPSRLNDGRFQKRFPKIKTVRLLHRPGHVGQPEGSTE